MKNYLQRVSLVLFVLMNVLVLQAKETKGILVDNSKRELIAPEGDSFQWYYNGELVEEAVSKVISPKKSGTYRVDIRDKEGNFKSSSIVVRVTATGICKVHLIGDSTVSNYGGSQYPFKGWGQVLQWFFDDTKVQVTNHARGGRSSRSFYQEGLWTPVKNSLDSGDYVLIQFGHNDRDFTKPERFTPPDSMKIYLGIYINDTRAKGAIPVLVSPMSMNTGTRNVFTETGSDYRGAMLEMADSMDVPFIDLNIKSWDFYQQIGVDYAKFFVHMGLEPGEYPNYPDGYEDYWTHYQEMGAAIMAKFVTDGIREQDSIPSLAILDSALKPLHSVSINLSKPNAGMVTLSGDFPEGATLTMKTRLDNPNDELKYWVDSLNTDTLESSLPGGLVSFTMEAKDYAFTGYVTDCNGTENGTATIDACGVCAGGDTGLEPCTGSLPCVDVCETNANAEILLENTENYYSLFLATDSIAQAWLSQEVSVTTADTFLFALNYDNPIPGESVDVYVDGAMELSALPLDVTTEWEIKEFRVYLEQGTHTLRFQNTSSTGGVRYDYLAVFSDNNSIEDCSNRSYAQARAFGQEDSLVVIEAENYANLFPASNGTYWRKAIFEGASAGKVIIAPAGPTYGSGATAQSNAPVARYQVDIPNAGDYHVWARVYAFNPVSDSYHMGINGEVTFEKIDLFNSTSVYEQFTWMHLSDRKLPVPTAGITNLELYGREPHFIIDKFILTLDGNYSPSNLGPEETAIPFITSVEENPEITAPAIWMAAYPNPASTELHIDYELKQAGMVNISIFNATGQIISELANEFHQPGIKHLNWDFGGKANVLPGLYMIRLQTAKGALIQKIQINR